MRMAGPSGIERFDVLRRAEQIRLDGDADARALRARALEELDRRIDVRRSLHVDPDEVAALLGALDQAIHVALAQPAIEIEAELRRLDRDVRVEPGRLDLVEHLEIVLRDLLELLRLRQVLAEARQDGVDAELLLFLRRRSASSTRSPGMNRVTDRRTNAPLGHVVAQPRVGRRCEQRLSHHAH